MNTAQYIFINSADRYLASDTSSDIHINLNCQYNNLDDLSLQIQHVVIPQSYFNVNSNNNTFTLGITSGTTGWSTGTEAITAGNYSVSTLPSVLFSETGVSGVYNATTNQFTFGVVNGDEFDLTTTIQHKFLGLSAGTHSSSSGVITSDVSVDFSGVREIRIWADIPFQSTTTWDRNSNVLAVIYPSESFGDYCVYKLENFAPITVQNGALNGNHRIRLLDEYNQLIDLRGSDWSMTWAIYPH
jgi:hypothetical protein